MKVKVHRTDLPYKITKSSIEKNNSQLPRIGSANKNPSKSISNKKTYEIFFLQYLVSFGLLTKGGLVNFAKRKKSNKGTKFFTVEVVSPPGKKITYTLDGVSDSALGIAIRLSKLGANSFYCSIPFNQKSLVKDLQECPWANSVLSYFNMLTSCGILSGMEITYLDPKTKVSKKGILNSNDGIIRVYGENKYKFTAKDKKKSLEWLLSHLNSYSIPSTCLYERNGMKKILELSKKAELSAIQTTKLAVWHGKDRRNDFSQVFCKL